MEDRNLLNFKHIATFVKKINDMCGEGNINIQLYNRLIEKANINSLQKHIDLFGEFCRVNKEIINESDTKFEQEEVRFSEKIFINMKDVLESCNEDNTDELWSDLGKLSNKLCGGGGLAKGNNFLMDMVSKVESSVDVNSSNPMEAITSMMSSGVFSELVGTMTSGLQNGDINLGSLFGQMNEMVGQINPGESSSSSSSRPSKQRRNNKKKKPKRK